MKIKMIKTTAGANDGIRVVEYQAGEVYDLSDSLSKAFLGMGVAKDVTEVVAEDAPTEEQIVEAEIENQEEVEQSPSEEEVEEKMQNSAPENKSTKPSNNKGKNGGKA